jgi:tRNA nucleotidyltransferase (CCA-adding enzyme)
VPVDGHDLLERLAGLPRGRAVLEAADGVPGIYLVGGAVRDLALGLTPHEIDLTVEADPEPLLAKLGGADVEHERFGTATVDGVDVVRARAEHYAQPGALPDVRPAGIDEDLARRDFTVNAIARRLETDELVDPFNGQQDLRDRVLRTVGPRSFAEDPLRLVRGLRLVSERGLSPDESTLRQMQEEAGNVRLVSGERLGDELAKLLLGREPARALRLAREAGVLAALLPELDPPLDDHVFSVVQAAADADASLAVRLAALLHDTAKKKAPPAEHAARGAELAQQALERLRYPGRLQAYVVRLIAAHSFWLDGIDERFARRFLRDHGEELAFDLVTHKEADLSGKGRTDDELAAGRLRELLEQQRAHPHRLQDLAVDGSDLLELGYREGPELGRTLQELLDAVVDDPSLNTREQLLARARR